jgi:hypothetical protein
MIMQNIKESKKVLEYCYQHADRPNPVQDLIDKGLITWGYFSNDNCNSVTAFYNTYQLENAEFIYQKEAEQRGKQKADEFLYDLRSQYQRNKTN